MGPQKSTAIQTRPCPAKGDEKETKGELQSEAEGQAGRAASSTPGPAGRAGQGPGVSGARNRLEDVKRKRQPAPPSAAATAADHHHTKKQKQKQKLFLDRRQEETG